MAVRVNLLFLTLVHTPAILIVLPVLSPREALSGAREKKHEHGLGQVRIQWHP